MIHPIGEGRGRLVKAELERIAHTPTENLEAYDYFLQGRVYVDRFNKEDNLRAREMFEKAIELDPGYAFAITRYVWTYLFDYWWSWTLA